MTVAYYKLEDLNASQKYKSSYIFAKHLGLPTYSMPPSIITLEQSKFDFSEALVIVISQSGKSADLVECERKSRLMGAHTVIITNNVTS